MNLPVAVDHAQEIAQLGEDARSFIDASRSESTTRSYRLGWQCFEAWCQRHGREALPATADTVARYLADLASQYKPATIDLRLAAIAAGHRAAGLDSPTKAEAVRLVRRGIRRTLGTAQRQVRPIVTDDLRRMVRDLGDDTQGVRDRALLLIGFAGAFRRSELVGLNIEDLVEGPDGLTVHLRHSKTDQEGAERTVGVPYGSNRVTCPVRAWREWLEIVGTHEGPAFRPVTKGGRVLGTRLSSHSASAVVKRRAERAGINPAEVAGHSLRAGLVTAAAQAGVAERVIAEQTGHRNMDTLRKYIRASTLFKENAASLVGL